MEAYLEGLNQQQYEAVVYSDGPALVIAGAGSGKTKVLTHKIMHLLKNGYNGEEILALTFTNKAAREMKERISTLLGAEFSSKIWMGTFHSNFLRILKTHCDRLGYASTFTIYEPADTKSLLKSIIKEECLDEKKYAVNIVANCISSAKNALKFPDDYANDPALMARDRHHDCPYISEIYRIYQQRCKVAEAMDFDDILMFTNILFRDNPDILEKYQTKFKYILVDEYQDTNFAQHMIIRQLVAKNQRLFAVGDDAQSIYSFRGANISNILGLSKLFPNLKIFKLERNYRSTQMVVNAANSLIAKNTRQIRKDVFSENELGNKLLVMEAATDLDEGKKVSSKLFEIKMRQHFLYSDFAILYRTNAQSRIIEEALRKDNITYRIYGGMSFYQRREIKDALCYFRLAVNPDDNEALCKIINYPVRGIGETTVGKLRKLAADSNASIWTVLQNIENIDSNFNTGTKSKLASFRELIERLTTIAVSSDAYSAAVLIYDETGLLRVLNTSDSPENVSKRENLDELLNAIKAYCESSENEYKSLSDFVANISLITEQDEDADTSDKVTLMTVHAAKGLEFNNVFIVGLEENLFPSFRSVSNYAEIEEERRLLYVAITRAKKNCIMTYARSRFRNGQSMFTEKSRFINDIDPTCLQLPFGSNFRTNNANSSGRNPKFIPLKGRSEMAKQTNATIKPDQLVEGLVVKHKTFGIGKVMTIDKSMGDTKIIVKFENGAEKKLLLRFANLEIVK